MMGGAEQPTEALEALVASSPIRAVTIVAWRDLDDPEAGGSELHAHLVATRWAAAGLDVTLRTSMVPGAAHRLERDGYQVVRQGGRYGVFPQVALEGLRHGAPAGTALLEVWNGMPFFSPLWFRGPRLVFIHHVHRQMWEMVLSKGLARLGNGIESRLAPPFYRRSAIATPSSSSRQEIIELLGMSPERVVVVPNGIEPRFSPGPGRSMAPHVVAVGRLVPVKRFDLLLHALAEAKTAIPELTATIIGEGYERPALEALRAELGATSWVEMPGRVSDEGQLEAYRRAWVVASSSLREGWGMTLTEGAACGVPAVASDIAGHRDSVQEGVSGLLVSDGELGGALVKILGDEALRERLAAGALAYAQTLTWDRTAVELFARLDERARR